MTDIWASVAEVAATLPLNWVEVLARGVEKSNAPADWPRIVASTNIADDLGVLEKLGAAWVTRSEIPPSSLAAGLRSAAATAQWSSAQQKIELVWTGPGTSFIPMRRTEQVVQQVIDAARQQIWLTSYVFVHPEGIAANLRAASARGVKIIALLESPKLRGGQIDHDPAENLNAIVPAAKIFEWTVDAKRRAGLSLGGCVHAKCIVADTAAAFITSANLTGSAMERNMEMGILINGGLFPQRISDHLDMLCNTEIIRSVHASNKYQDHVVKK